MANLILPKYSSVSQLTITLASLASSTSGVGRQGTIVDNTTTRYKRIYLFPRIKLGTSPTSSTLIRFYLIRDDTNSIRTDGAGSSDAGLTVKNAIEVYSLTTGSSAATGDTLTGDCVIEDPGPKWTIAVVNSSGVALDSTGGNHQIDWFGEDDEVQ